MKQGRVSRLVFVLVAAGAVAACQVVSGLASLDEPAGEDPGTDASPNGDGASIDGPIRDALAEASREGGPDTGDAGEAGDARDSGPDGAWDGGSRTCVGLADTCGSYEDPGAGGAVVGTPESCCVRRDVPAGTSYRLYDYVDGGLVDAEAPATISSFALDRFEVTVGRFHVFLTAYENGWRPAAGSGRALRSAGDPGWTFDAALKPGNTFRAAVAACEESTFALDPRLPMNCITYPEALAFCIYDGGRLPTEAEWAFAAAGGAELRMQPFSVPPSQLVFTMDLYQASASGSTLVGVHTGHGKFGHTDLLGNIAEWVRDAHVSPYPSAPCTNCMIDSPDASAPRSVRGLGFDYEVSIGHYPRNTMRESYGPATRTWNVGVRCAYDLP